MGRSLYFLRFSTLRRGNCTIGNGVRPRRPSVRGGRALDSLTSPTKIMLRIKTSKTDPFRSGVTICLGRTGRDLYPVAALLSFIALAPGPLFHFQDGTALTRPALVRELRSALQAIGVDARHYSGHSFRIVAATSAAAAGVEDSIIKILGRWQSSAYTQYVRVPPDQLAEVSSRLAGP